MTTLVHAENIDTRVSRADVAGWEIHWPLFLLLVVGTAVLYVLPNALGRVIYPLMALHALRGPRQTVEAIALMALALLGNPVVFPDGVKIFRWLVLFAGFGRVLWDTFIGDRALGAQTSVLQAVGAFALTTLVLAVTSGWMPGLSMFKLTVFCIGIVTLFVSFYRTLHLTHYWRSWFLTYFTAIAVLSMLIYPLGIGYLRTGQGYQGIMIHPQTLGPMAGVLMSCVAGYCVVRPDRSTQWLPVLGALGALVFLSGSRTGAVVLAGGAVLSFFVFAWRRDEVALGPLLMKPATFVAIFVLGTVLLLFPASLQEPITAFIQKDAGEEATGVSELYEDTRGELIEMSMNNFRAAPLVGIGFGIPSDPASLDPDAVGYERVEYVMGIPVSASYEKGFMPAAVLEEVGVLGALFLIMLLAAIAVPVIRYGSFPVVWTFLAAFLVNFSEAVLFSIGGLGLMIWMLFAFCHAQAVARRNRLWQGQRG
ncbi:MAG TPA: O-antigen ligase family protein [Rhodothermales bacterium]|nr:O-antigen ligase family protein [Rhodothermales bacterium]